MNIQILLSFAMLFIDASSTQYGPLLNDGIHLSATPPIIGQEMSFTILNKTDEKIAGLTWFGLAPFKPGVQTDWGLLLVAPVRFMSNDVWQVESGSSKTVKFQVPNSEALIGLHVYLQTLAVKIPSKDFTLSNGLDIMFGNGTQ